MTGIAGNGGGLAPGRQRALFVLWAKLRPLRVPVRPESTGKIVELPDRPERAVATVHPSSVLRSNDRETAYQELVADLKSAATVLGDRQRQTRR